MKTVTTKLRDYPSVLALLIISAGVRADEPREVRGRVVDQAGMPVADAAVGVFWRANGSGRGGRHCDRVLQ